MSYDLWDGELGQSLGSYDTEAAALTAVLALTAASDSNAGAANVAPLGLIADGKHVIATGNDLVRRAQLAEAV